MNRSYLSLCIALAIVVSLAMPAFAQQTIHTITERHGDQTVNIEFQPAGTTNLDVNMLRAFTEVKNIDPSVSDPIARNPSRVTNEAFIAKHPALKDFLARYPSAAQEIVDNPGNFVTPVAGSKWASHEAAGIPRN